MATNGWAAVTGIGHVRITVSDIEASKTFYQQLLGVEPVIDNSDQVHEPGVRQDPQKFFGGCVFPLGDQVFGLRPADAGGSFDPAGIGLDHVSFAVGSVADLHEAVVRLDQAGVEHGDIIELSDAGMAILSIQDPDNINIELTTAL